MSRLVFRGRVWGCVVGVQGLGFASRVLGFVVFGLGFTVPACWPACDSM